MNSKILIVYEYQILFEILNEIKENLNFEVIKSNKNDFNNIKFDQKSNFLIISSKKQEDSKPVETEDENAGIGGQNKVDILNQENL